MRNKISFVVLLIIIIPTLACSLLDRFTGGAEQPAPVIKSLETEQSQEQQQAVVEDVQQTQDQQQQSADAPSAPAGAGQFMGVTGLENLSSYRVSYVMDFDGTSGGQPAQGHIEMMLSATKEPPARHLAMSMEGATVENVGGGNKVEFYEVGDKIYMYSQAADVGQWFSMSSSADTADAFRQGFFAPDEDLELPDTAQCDTSQTETVNGVAVYVCTFDETNVNATDATYDQLEGRAWIAQDGNYIVKFTLNAQGYRSLVEGENLFDFGNVNYEYNLQDINANFTITPPQEALDAPDMFGGSGAPDQAQAPELPVPDNAEDLVSIGGIVTFYVPSNVAGMVDYYRRELPPQGWQEDESAAFVDEQTALLSFNKDGQNLTITMNTEADGRVNVGLITAQ